MTNYTFSEFMVEAGTLRKEGVSKRKIVKTLATKYGMKENSLISRWRRHLKAKETCNLRPRVAARLKNIRVKGKRILSTEEEAALVTLLKVSGRTNHGLRRSDVIEYVGRKYMKGDATWRGDKFLKMFLKTNQRIIKAANLKVISSGRIDENSIQSCEEFIQDMEETVANYNMKAE